METLQRFQNKYCRIISNASNSRERSFRTATEASQQERSAKSQGTRSSSNYIPYGVPAREYPSCPSPAQKPDALPN